MKKSLIISIIFLIGFIIITILLLTNNLYLFDNYIYKIFLNIRSNGLTYIMKTITYMGNTIPVIIILIIFLIFFNQKDRLLLGSSMIITLIINQIIKYTIRRPRPPIEERLITQGGYSYPSGHSMMALCLYGVLIYLVLKNIKNTKLKIILITFLVIIILAIGISRIYVRVHYPSDVLAGFLLTISIIIININILEYLFRGQIENEDADK